MDQFAWRTWRCHANVARVRRFADQSRYSSHADSSQAMRRKVRALQGNRGRNADYPAGPNLQRSALPTAAGTERKLIPMRL